MGTRLHFRLMCSVVKLGGTSKMSKQTRRSISVNGDVYAKLAAHCARRGEPVARVTQGLIEQLLLKESARSKRYTVSEAGTGALRGRFHLLGEAQKFAEFCADRQHGQDFLVLDMGSFASRHAVVIPGGKNR